MLTGKLDELGEATPEPLAARLLLAASVSGKHKGHTPSTPRE